MGLQADDPSVLRSASRLLSSQRGKVFRKNREVERAIGRLPPVAMVGGLQLVFEQHSPLRRHRSLVQQASALRPAR
jgi:hypothetical protein